MIEIRTLAAEDIDALGRLFGTEKSVASCWCMWFIVRVKDYHAGGAAENAARFAALAGSEHQPLGLVAHSDGEVVGWAALGPRSRYARAVKTPTMRSIDPADNDAIWLLPCFFIRPDMRRKGVARRLLEHAIAVAGEAGAPALEGFPTAGSRVGSADRQVGTESLFASMGFSVVDRPSSNRVLMRRKLAAR